MIEVKKYNLPDIDILQSMQLADLEFFVWQPDKSYLILGSSNKAETSLFTDRVIADQIEVFKRPSGGESVILTSKTLVLATIIRTKKLEDPPTHFLMANRKIINALESFGVKNISQKGISDIAIGQKKIAGSSIYRKTTVVFFHCVLNVAEDTSLMEKYLAFPQKQPDYRQNRSHSDFVTSLLKEGYQFDADFSNQLAIRLNTD